LAGRLGITRAAAYRQLRAAGIESAEIRDLTQQALRRTCLAEYSRLGAATATPAAWTADPALVALRREITRTWGSLHRFKATLEPMPTDGLSPEQRGNAERLARTEISGYATLSPSGREWLAALVQAGLLNRLAARLGLTIEVCRRRLFGAGVTAAQLKVARRLAARHAHLAEYRGAEQKRRRPITQADLLRDPALGSLRRRIVYAYGTLRTFAVLVGCTRTETGDLAATRRRIGPRVTRAAGPLRAQVAQVRRLLGAGPATLWELSRAMGLPAQGVRHVFNVLFAAGETIEEFRGPGERELHYRLIQRSQEKDLER
jgi:hypothetical protein